MRLSCLSEIASNKSFENSSLRVGKGSLLPVLHGFLSLRCWFPHPSSLTTVSNYSSAGQPAHSRLQPSRGQPIPQRSNAPGGQTSLLPAQGGLNCVSIAD